MVIFIVLIYPSLNGATSFDIKTDYQVLDKKAINNKYSRRNSRMSYLLAHCFIPIIIEDRRICRYICLHLNRN